MAEGATAQRRLALATSQAPGGASRPSPAPEAPCAPGTSPAEAGKYLIFALAHEEYALEVATAREIIGMPHITPVPCTPPFVRGVFNYRGTAAPAIDLRVAFGLPAEQTDDTCVIIADSGDAEIGMIVDRVVSVIDVGPDQIEGALPVAAETTTALIRGIRRDQGDVAIVLDIGMVMPPDAARALARSA